MDINVGIWTKDEHRLFLAGLEVHGKDWEKISKMIPTRTISQVRTHAQKYFVKLEKNEGKRLLFRYPFGDDLTDEKRALREKNRIDYFELSGSSIVPDSVATAHRRKTPHKMKIDISPVSIPATDSSFLLSSSKPNTSVSRIKPNERRDSPDSQDITCQSVSPSDLSKSTIVSPNSASTMTMSGPVKYCAAQPVYCYYPQPIMYSQIPAVSGSTTPNQPSNNSGQAACNQQGMGDVGGNQIQYVTCQGMPFQFIQQPIFLVGMAYNTPMIQPSVNQNNQNMDCGKRPVFLMPTMNQYGITPQADLPVRMLPVGGNPV